MKYYIDLFGCVKNQVDAENMMALLNGAGWSQAEDAEAADLIIVNSCGFIESAKKESINAVLAWRKDYPEKKIFLAGCLAQRYAKELAESLPEADGLFGVDDISGIAAAAGKVVKQPGDAETSSSPKASSPGSEGRRPLLSLPGSAYVKISEGCDNNCSYCAIPLIRGKLKSRSAGDIIEECKVLLGRGIKELCLIGQDTGSYGRDLPGLAAVPASTAALSPGAINRAAAASPGADQSRLPDLLKALSHLEGNFRIRLLYLHPDNFPMEILDIMAKDRRFIPYFDIPFQHGSEKILKAMKRRGNVEVYLKLIGSIRESFEDAVIRSTFMTGFPGETEEDFLQLLDFQQKARLDWLGCFAYSREDGTAAWNMKGRVSKKIAAERKRIIEEGQIPITEKQMDRFIGRTFEVLIEEKIESPGADDPVIYLGRLPSQAPEVDGSTVITAWEPAGFDLGSLIPCRISARSGFDLKAEPVAISPKGIILS